MVIGSTLKSNHDVSNIPMQLINGLNKRPSPFHPWGRGGGLNKYPGRLVGRLGYIFYFLLQSLSVLHTVFVSGAFRGLTTMIE